MVCINVSHLISWFYLPSRQIFNLLFRFRGVGKKDVEARKKSHSLQKSTFQDKVRQLERHIANAQDINLPVKKKIYRR